MSKKVQLTKQELAAYKINSQQDLDRLQKVWNENLPEPVEFEPFRIPDDEVSEDVKAYLAAKGIKFNEGKNAPVNTPVESVISAQDIQQFIQQKNK